MSTDPLKEKSVAETLGQSTEYAKALIQVKVDQIKLDAVERGTQAISSLLVFLFIGLGVGAALLFGFFALALYLGELLDSQILGFVCVSGLILLLTLIFYTLRQKLITTPVMRRLAHHIYQKQKSENHE